MSDEQSLMRFRVRSVELAIEAGVVEEVVEQSSLTLVPGVPSHIPGVVAVRGEAVPLLDLGAFLGLEATGTDDVRESRVLLVRVTPYRVGLLCDAVLGIVTFDSAQHAPPASLQPAALRGYSSAELDLGGAVGALLDLPSLLEAARA
ncbi:MAG: chemotaxis protein CheW [Sandaracinaceae bacterium]|nr:chemotaxis protein CheW [Sandaracinaceae bacterium]